MALYLGSQKVCPIIKVETQVGNSNNNVAFVFTNFSATQTSEMYLLPGNVSDYNASLAITPNATGTYSYSNQVGGKIFYWSISPNTDYSLFYQSYTGVTRYETINISVDTCIGNNLTSSGGGSGR